MHFGVITQWNTIQPKRINNPQPHAAIWMNLTNITGEIEPDTKECVLYDFVYRQYKKKKKEPR